MRTATARIGLMVAMQMGGCGPADSPDSSATGPGRPPNLPSRAPAPPPSPPPPGESPLGTPATGHAATPPRPIPREALAHRDNFIRIWRYYFALAQSPTIGFAQVHQESRWRAEARSKYASGLAQFTPATARDYSRLLPAEVRARCPDQAGCPTDPHWALNALSLYDYRLHKQYAWAATTDDRWRLALAAYNGGAGWITKERQRANGSTRWIDIVNACMRSPASCKENREYPVRILENWLPFYKQWLGL